MYLSKLSVMGHDDNDSTHEPIKNIQQQVASENSPNEMKQPENLS